MCGISGVYALHNPPTEGELEDMNRCQRHRGPDSEGYFIDDPVGFAHRRLSIIDVATGDQPIENEDESVVTIFNGEIYNYSALRDQLETAGHTFTTETDTEVLVHLYEEYGDSFVEYLKGMFAFALWDRNEKRLLLARDRIGIKPLFFANDGDRIGFASELPPLLRSNIDQGNLDRRGISEYFALGYVPAPGTAFENIEKICPGELVVVSDESVQRRQFYEPSINRVDSSFSRVSARLRELITESVQKRLMSDVPLGTFLSGGIDSTITTGIMSKLRNDPVNTFTVGFENELFDESEMARTVAEYHGTDHTEFILSADDVREVVPTVLSRLGEPFADPSLIPTYVVSRETRNEVKVALSGDGADELFAGYNRYRGEYYSKYYRSLPEPIRSMLIEPTFNRLPTTRNTTFGEAIRKGQKFVSVNADDTPIRHFEWVVKTTEDATDIYGERAPLDDGREVLRREHRPNQERLPEGRRDPMSQIMAVDVYHGLPNQMLQKVDLASMYNSLEVRVPFLDTSLVEYVQGLPISYKITARDRKRILKHAFSDLIPPEIRSRSKQGFEMPIGEWFKNELEEDFRSTISQLDCLMIENDAVMSIHDRHVSGKRDYEWLLWNVYVFARWHNRMKSEEHL
ncbi:asparagine synthase (glutamine-hydrolyzing) [Halobacteriales archaeon SW_6_65_46]|nr:MAG: asparagine synthase (glutamine-hydrolyzing) [Halobacteriales archaeon SW_6_65_46]